MASGALHGQEIKVGTKVQGAKDTLSTRVSKSEYAKVSRRSTSLQLGEEHDIHRNQNITSKVSRTQVYWQFRYIVNLQVIVHGQ